MYYYGIVNPNNGPNDMALPLHAGCTLGAQCPQCHETFHSNISLMDHLKHHVSNTDTNVHELTGHQCRYCLLPFQTPDLLERHLAAQHPTTTRNGTQGFACLICDVRMPNTLKLSAHMQKTHVGGEMPYRCGGCSYASSSLRSSVDHFYAEHAGSAALQCPLCMQCWTVRSSPGPSGRLLAGNVAAYLEHLRQHLRPASGETALTSTIGRPPAGLKCSRCTLSFFTAGAAKMHQYAHVGQTRRVNEALCPGQTKIAKPKPKYNYVTNNVLVTERFDTITMVVENGLVCLECDADFEERSHFP